MGGWWEGERAGVGVRESEQEGGNVYLCERGYVYVCVWEGVVKRERCVNMCTVGGMRRGVYASINKPTYTPANTHAYMIICSPARIHACIHAWALYR